LRSGIVPDGNGDSGVDLHSHDLLGEKGPDRRLYLAIRQEVYEELFTDPIGQLLLKRERLKLLVFEPERGVIVQGIPDRANPQN
jgi:hypothetical protein